MFIKNIKKNSREMPEMEKKDTSKEPFQYLRKTFSDWLRFKSWHVEKGKMW